jgi:hypothetical protein
VLALGFKALIVASNRLLGLSAGTVALQLVVQRLATVASNCCDGVAEELDVVVELLLPPQEARRVDKKVRVASFIML